MAPKETTNADGLTTREAELAVLVIKCLKVRPDINYDLLASLGNYSAANSARVNVNKVFRKLIIAEKTGGEEAADSVTKATLKKRKAVECGDAEADTPKKKSAPKSPKKSKKDAKADSEANMAVKEEEE